MQTYGYHICASPFMFGDNINYPQSTVNPGGHGLKMPKESHNLQKNMNPFLEMAMVTTEANT